MRSVRVANAGGYWGDDPDAVTQQVRGGPIDYLTMDYLAEITMVILQKMAAKDPTKGWATDVVPALAPVLPEVLARGIRVVTNAGGVNPQGCADALARAAAKLGLSPRIAVVSNSELDVARLAPPHADTGAPFSEISGRVEASYVYMGALAIVEALAAGAQIVVCGRVVDAALALGPLVFEHGWRWGDWDLLAAGVVAGHVIECGAQATGGNQTDWRSVPALERVGYPIAEVTADGAVTVTKHPGTGGAVTRQSVVEQLLYEIGDPRAYATPDVTADFTSIQLREESPDRVTLTGMRGAPPPQHLKAGISYAAGWKCAGTYLLGPPGARAKAEELARIFWARDGTAYEETLTEALGRDEVFLRLAVRDASRDKVEAFSRRFASYALSGPPGVTIPGGGRPPVQEVYGFWPALVADGDPDLEAATRPLPSPARTGRKWHGSLGELAFARSGDKGDKANIGVAARGEDEYRILESVLTPELVRQVFREECRGEVLRYALPNLLAFNLILSRALGGGGVVSLRSDPQGKLFAQRLLAHRV